MPPVGNILTREILHYIEREADRARDAANAKPRKAAPIAQPKAAPAPAAPKAPARRMVEITAPASNDLTVLQRKRDRDLLRIEGDIPPGHKALRLLRSDIEIKPGLMGWKGDEVALPEYQAHRMVENSAAEFIEPAPASASAPEGAESAAPETPHDPRILAIFSDQNRHRSARRRSSRRSARGSLAVIATRHAERELRPCA